MEDFDVFDALRRPAGNSLKGYKVKKGGTF